MIALLLAAAWSFDEVERTPAIYRCPASEAVGKRFQDLVDNYGFDTLCLDPKPTPSATAVVKGKLKLIDSKLIDTPANRKWRDATVAFAAGKISPKEWVARTRNLKETVHFLSSPSTPDLRSSTQDLPGRATYSAGSVFAEILLLSLPGRPCLTSGDTWRTRELPDAGRLQSWVLAMNDYLGPMLYTRHESPFMVSKKPAIVRADSQPGLLIFRQTDGKNTLTFYFNNAAKEVALPLLGMDKVTINSGLNLDGPKPVLMPSGYIIEGR